jgi:hypothetical protein
MHPIQPGQRTESSLMGVSSLLSQPLCGGFGHPPGANSSCGYCCRTESGQPIVCYLENGLTIISARCVGAIWKLQLICLWNARSSFVCGMPGGKTSLARYQCVDSSTRVQPLALAPWPRNCRLVRRVNEAFRRVVGQKERCPFPCHPSVLAHLAGTKCTSI